MKEQNGESPESSLQCSWPSSEPLPSSATCSSAKDKAVADEALVDVYVVDKLVPKGAEPATIRSSVSIEHIPARLEAVRGDHRSRCGGHQRGCHRSPAWRPARGGTTGRQRPGDPRGHRQGADLDPAWRPSACRGWDAEEGRSRLGCTSPSIPSTSTTLRRPLRRPPRQRTR